MNEVIVYRNPAEKALWDFIGSPIGTYLLLGICGLMAFWLVLTIGQSMWQSYRFRKRFRNFR